MSPNAGFSIPDRFPQIIKLASELEFNLGSEPIISCVATGNPLPASDGVELRKADGTMLKVPQKPLPFFTSLPSFGTVPAPKWQNPQHGGWQLHQVVTLTAMVADSTSVPTAGQSHYRVGADHVRVSGAASDEGRRRALGMPSLYYWGPGQPESQGQHSR